MAETRLPPQRHRDAKITQRFFLLSFMFPFLCRVATAWI